MDSKKGILTASHTKQKKTIIEAISIFSGHTKEKTTTKFFPSFVLLCKTRDTGVIFSCVPYPLRLSFTRDKGRDTKYPLHAQKKICIPSMESKEEGIKG